MESLSNKVFSFVSNNRKKIAAIASGTLVLSAFWITFFSSAIQIAEPKVTPGLASAGLEAESVRKKFQASMLSLSDSGEADGHSVLGATNPRSDVAGLADNFTAGAPYFELSDTFSVDIAGNSLTFSQFAKFLRQLTGQRVVEIQLAVQCKAANCEADSYTLAANIFEDGVPGAVRNFSFELDEDALEGSSATAAFRAAAAYLLAETEPLDGIRFFIREGKFEEAESTIGKARALSDVDHQKLRYLHAELALKQGEFAVGTRRFRQLAEDSPEDYYAHEGVGRGLLALAIGQGGDAATIEQAVDALLRAAEIDKQTWRAPSLISLAFASVDKDENTKKYALEALSKDFMDKDRRARLLLATLLEDSDNCELAWQEYLSLAGDGLPSAQAIVGSEYTRDNFNPRDDERALTWLQRASDAESPMGTVGLGIMYSKGNHETWLPVEERSPDQEKAMELFRDAISLGHKSAYANWIATKVQVDGIGMDDELREVLDQGLDQNAEGAVLFDLYLHSLGVLRGEEEPREFANNLSDEQFATRGELGQLLAEEFNKYALIHSLRYWSRNGINLFNDSEMAEFRRSYPALGDYPDLAVRLYNIASLNGSDHSPLFLGLMLGDPDLKEHDAEEALKWIYIAEERNGAVTTLENSTDARSTALLQRVREIEREVRLPIRRRIQEIASKPSSLVPDRCHITLQFDFGNWGELSSI